MNRSSSSQVIDLRTIGRNDQGITGECDALTEGSCTLHFWSRQDARVTQAAILRNLIGKDFTGITHVTNSCIGSTNNETFTMLCQCIAKPILLGCSGIGVTGNRDALNSVCVVGV